MQPRWRELVRRRLPQLSREVTEEIADHLADLYAESLRGGATETVARQTATAALREEEALLRDPTAVPRQPKPNATGPWQLGQPSDATTRSGAAMFLNLGRDVRYAVRLLLRQRAFAATAILTLTLGIGVNVAVFSVMRAALVASVPVPRPDRLMSIVSWTQAGGDHSDFSYPLYVDARDGAARLADVAGYTDGSVGIATGDVRDRVLAEFITSNYFSVLGLNLHTGRGLSGPDEMRGAPLVAVISDQLWRSMFASAADLSSQSVLIDGQLCAIVGVAPSGFTGFVRGQRADIWIPISQFFVIRHRPDMLSERRSSWMSLVGRLHDGVSRDQLQAQLTTVLRPVFGGEGCVDCVIHASPATLGDMSLVTDLSSPLRLLMAVVGLILIITAANVANLLLARSYSRQAEMAVRQSLGASRARIVHQLVVEAGVLAAIGGAGALAAGIWVARLFKIQTSAGAAALSLSIQPDGVVILFTAGLAVIAALAIGLTPTIDIRRFAPVGAIRTATHGTRVISRRGRLRGALTIVQIALSFVLIVGASLFLRSLSKVRDIDPSLRSDSTVAATLNMSLRGYDEAHGRQFYERVLEAVSRQRGIESAALTLALPVTNGGIRLNLDAGATTPTVDAPVEFQIVPVSPDFFRTINLPVLQGREFAASDTPTSPKVIVINEQMKARLWPLNDPVGQTFQADGTTFLVVGVARDTKYRSLREAPRMTMYMPLAQSYEAAVTLVVRSALRREATVTELREAVRSVDPSMPFYNVRTMAEHVDQSLYLDRLRADLVSLLAGLALALAAVGLYGVVAYDVTQRTREVGIRLALGAQPGEVVRMLLAGGTKLAVAGLVVGAGLSFWLTRSVASLLYGITPYDPVALAGAATVLLGVALIATYLPARRATRIDPVAALRQS